MSNTQKLYNAVQDLPLIVIDSPKCYAVISLSGGQILEFKAKDKPALLWLSPIATFELGKPIRGGVPICAPWFGPYKGAQTAGLTYPNHGFARTSLWTKNTAITNANGEVAITLALNHTNDSEQVYPHQFAMELSFTLSDKLSVEFSIINKSAVDIDCEWALHSYFAIEDIAKTAVSGLDTYQYVDSANNAIVDRLNGNLHFPSEVDRYFVYGSQDQKIENLTPINISGSHCNSVITWNPGAQLAAKMVDISERFYHQFVCVERGAIFENQWQIAPAQKKTAKMVLSN